MTHFVTLRTGLPGSHQFSRYASVSFEDAHASAERAFVSKMADYLIEDYRGPITYRLSHAM
jgi:hypothetical protein